MSMFSFDSVTVNHTTTGARKTGSIWPALAILTAATFWTVTAEILPSGLLPSMSSDLGVSASAVGTLVSAWAITIAVVSIPLVRLTLRIPRRALLSLSLAGTGLANLVTAAAQDYPIALIGRILAATAHGLFWAVVVSYVASVVAPARLGRALSIVLAGPSLAGLAGLPAAAFVAEHTGWRVVFTGLSVILLLTALTLWRLLPHRDGGAAPSPRGSWDRSAIGVVLVAGAGGLVLIGHFAVFTYITTLITGHAGLEPTAIPALLLVLGVTGAIGVVASGSVSDRFPRGAVTAAAGLVAVGLTLLSLGGGRPGSFIIGVGVWGLAIGAFPPILQARVLRLSSSSFQPLAGSIVVTVLNLGVAAGATLGGIVLPRGPDILAYAAVACAAAGTLTFALHRVASWSPSERRNDDEGCSEAIAPAGRPRLRRAASPAEHDEGSIPRRDPPEMRT